jgi:hypothetical protein
MKIGHPPMRSFRSVFDAAMPIPSWRKAAPLVLLVFTTALLSGCETDSAKPGALSAQAAPAAPPPPMDHARAASECWMSIEKGHAGEDLDKRADYVTKCIQEKMKDASPPPKS